jgi:phosphate transport system ATP-binding protein
MNRPNHSQPQPPTSVGEGKERPAIVLATERLNAWFGAVRAVKEVSVQIRRNQVTAIIGPSGCGKSTLIRCLNRMHEVVPQARVEGRVYLDGWDIYGPTVDPVEVRRRIGMVFQKPNPFPTLSVYDNVAVGLRLNGVRKRSLLDAAVEESLRWAALWDEVKDKLRQPGTSLSGGQQQRLCIARTLAVKPDVILMDEPCSALDPIATARIEELLFELKKSYTVVLVTHNMQQAARVSDEAGFLLMGELVEFGPTGRLFTNPSDPRTEAYITGRFG